MTVKPSLFFVHDLLVFWDISKGCPSVRLSEATEVTLKVYLVPGVSCEMNVKVWLVVRRFTPQAIL